MTHSDPRDPLEAAARHAHAWLASLDTRSVAATVSRDELRRRFEAPLPERGVPAAAVVDDLAGAAEGGQLASGSGRFFAWVIGGALPSSVAAEWLVSAWDQNATIYATSPVASVVEEVAGQWLLDLFRLPRTSSFAFTTGCQMAHFTALSAAREQVLRQVGWDVGRQGMSGSPPIRLLVSAIRHVSLDRALRYLGIGKDQLHVLPVEADGGIAPGTLSAALTVDGPTIVCLNAGDLNTGAFDDFRALVPLAHARGAWVHVDGAFGLFGRASRRYDALVEGMELADSWATDCHKWLNVPQDSGFVAVRHPDAHRRAMTIVDSYFVAEDKARDEIDWTPEWSRRARGFGVYAALRELGREGVAALIERNGAQCEALASGMAALPGVELVSPPRLNQALVRFLDLRDGATDANHDARTERVITAINASGEAFFGPSTWKGQRVMRICVVNWRTTTRDVERTIAAVRHALTIA
ncbi:MAG: aspartate aminotransferase family protein [Gemmatimonadetes bacterium]|nr:aspartate aminotransferase family protein [Gemmatimonadota bacterium]